MLNSLAKLISGRSGHGASGNTLQVTEASQTGSWQVEGADRSAAPLPPHPLTFLLCQVQQPL